MKNITLSAVIGAMGLVGSSAIAATASLSGTEIPSSTQIIDASSNTWTLVSGVVYENGKPAGVSGGVTLVLYDNGKIYQENSAGKFWPWSGTAWTGPVADPRVASASGSKIPSASQLVDSHSNVWVLSGGVVYENGKAAGVSGGVTALYYVGGTIYQENASAKFWSWTGNAWVASGNPITGAGPSPTPSAKPSSTPTPKPSATPTATPTPTPTATATSTGGVQTGSHVAVDNIEVPSPFSSWANAKTTYGAKGDGETDDAPALQRALNNLGRLGKEGTLYLPAGTYVLKSSITLNAPVIDLPKSLVPGVGTQQAGNWAVSIVGESPSATILKWEGASGGAMIIENGGAGISVSRMTLDGQSKAGYGIAHWWNTTTKTLDANFSEHVDLVFQDMGIGIMGGRLGTGYGQSDSEGRVLRNTFLRMSYAGLDTGSSNADDWWIFDSQFIDCARGVTSNFSLTDGGTTNGAGGFYVYRSLFVNSSVADISFGNTKWFSIYENVSINSNQFFVSGGTGASAEIIIKGNRIIDTKDPVSILNGDVGPLILIDNEIRSLSATATPVESAHDGAEVFSTGNKYTVPPANFIKAGASGQRNVSLGDTQVAAASISACQPNTTMVQSACAPVTILPATPPFTTRKVFEVASGATGAEIQSVINEAAAAANSGTPNPIVHLPPGQYQISSSLVIPAKTRMQVVGDSSTTELNWIGPKGGSIFQLNGPSYATIRNMYFFLNFQTNSAAGISVSGADQAGGRVFLEGNRLQGITASHLAKSEVTAQENTNITFLNLTDVSNLNVVANGGVGPMTETNSNVTIIDTWWEGTESALYYKPSGGNITIAGADLNPASHSPAVQPVVAPVTLDGFSGSFSLIGAMIRENFVPKGITVEIESSNANTNAMFLGCNTSYYALGSGEVFSGINQTSTAGNVGFLSTMAMNASTEEQVANTGPQTLAFVNKMLTQLRALAWDNQPYSPPSGATDVRVYRVDFGATSGVAVTGN